MKYILLVLLLHTVSSLQAQKYVPVLVKEFKPGGQFSEWGNPSFMGEMDGKLVICAEENNARFLYTYAGTGEPQRILQLPLAAHSPVCVKLNNTIYFTDNRTQTITPHSRGLYKWDGKNPVTRVDDTTITGNIEAADPVVLNGKIYFSTHPVKNEEYYAALYSYDPATNTTRRVWHRAPWQTIAYKDKLYCRVRDSLLGDELFVFNPATGKGNLLADINAGSSGSYIESFLVMDELLWFSAISPGIGREVFVYDGSNPPRAVTDVPVGEKGIVSSSRILAYRHRLYFNGSDNGFNSSGFYRYDTRTQQLTKLITPDTLSIFHLSPAAIYHDNIILNGSDFDSRHVYSYNTTRKQIEQLPDPEGDTMLSIQSAMVYNGILYISATTPSRGRELYRYEDDPAISGPICLYPNPATTRTTLHTEIDETQRLTIKLVDAMGREVYHSIPQVYEAGIHEIDIFIPHLNPGVYICTLHGNRGMLFSGKLAVR